MEFQNKNPQILILSGKSGSGKSEIAKQIMNFYKGSKAVSLAYAYYLKDIAKKVLPWDGSEETKPRAFLQDLGNNLIKKEISKTFVIDRMIDDVKIYSYFFDLIIITDARFPEEIERIREKFSNVTVIRVNRNKKTCLSEKERTDVTETSLDNYENYDYIIENNSTIEDLTNEINAIVSDIINE